MVIALFVYLLCIACWLGAMFFFAFLTAPVIFRVLPRVEAGLVVSGIFPRYYLMGYVAGIIGVIVALYFAFVRGERLWWSCAAIALGVALALTLYAGTVILPRAEALRTVVEQTTPDPAGKAEFDRLHHLSVVLNSTVMVLNLLALLASAAALAPRG